MEQSNKVERSEVWNNIYEVLARLDLKEVEGDCLDRPSAATEIEQAIKKLLPIHNVMNWVAVEDELPQQIGSYLCFWENCYVGMLFFNSNKEWCEMWQQTKHKPTHWMHLPKQPCS